MSLLQQQVSHRSEVFEYTALERPWSAVCIAIFLLVVGRTLISAYRTPLRDIPGPWPAKFTRLWLLRAIASRSFQRINLDLHRKHGPIVRIAPNEYSIDDPDAAKILYRTGRQLEKSPRYLAWGVPTNEQNLFSATDITRHAERRRQTATLYQWSTLTGFESQLDRLTQELLGHMTKLADSGRETQLNHWFHYYALDAIGTIALGRPFGLLQAASDVAGLMESVQRYSRYGAVVGVFPELHPIIFRLVSLLTPSGAYGLGYLVQVMNQAIADETGSPGPQEKDVESLGKMNNSGSHFVSMLYSMHAANPAEFTHDDIRYHIVPAIGGGSDTTAITLSAAMYHLLRTPSAMHRLREELEKKEREGSLSHPVTLRQSTECNYLQAVIKETLRMYPGNGLPMPRVIPEGGLELAGRFFPAGTLVGINAWVANFNPTVFGPDADTFRPERWLDTTAEQITTMDNYFMTFGKGPRICLGKSIPFLEIGKLLPELLLNFELDFARGPSQQWRLLNDWFVRQEGFDVRVRRREGKHNMEGIGNKTPPK